MHTLKMVTLYHTERSTSEQLFFSFFKIFIYLFLEKEERREKERERNIHVWLPLTHPLLRTWPTTQACALTENQIVTLWFTGWHSIQ